MFVKESKSLSYVDFFQYGDIGKFTKGVKLSYKKEKKNQAIPEVGHTIKRMLKTACTIMLMISFFSFVIFFCFLKSIQQNKQLFII